MYTSLVSDAITTVVAVALGIPMLLKLNKQSRERFESSGIKLFVSESSWKMGEDDAEELVSMARGCDIPIYEHCYLAGLVDGMHLKETLEGMKKS